MIFDSPPLLSVTDPALVATLVDGVIFVLDAGRARRDTVKRGTEILRQANPAVVGTVLNKISVNAGRYYYYPSTYSQGGTGRRLDEGSKVLSKIFGRGKERRDATKVGNGNMGAILSPVWEYIRKLRSPRK